MRTIAADNTNEKPRDETIERKSSVKELYLLKSSALNAMETITIQSKNSLRLRVANPAVQVKASSSILKIPINKELIAREASVKSIFD